MAAPISKAKTAKKLVKQKLKDVRGVSGIGLTWDDDGHPAILIKAQTDAVTDIENKLADLDFSIPIIIEKAHIVSLEDY